MLRIACQANSEVDAEKAKKVKQARKKRGDVMLCVKRKKSVFSNKSKRVSSESKYTLSSVEQRYTGKIHYQRGQREEYMNAMSQESSSL